MVRGIVVGGGVAAVVSVQNALTILDEQAAGVTESAGVVFSDITMVGSGEEAGPTVSVCRVVGVGEISRIALTVWEGAIGDGLSSVHGRYTCVVILTISLSVQIKSVVLG